MALNFLFLSYWMAEGRESLKKKRRTSRKKRANKNRKKKSEQRKIRKGALTTKTETLGHFRHVQLVHKSVIADFRRAGLRTPTTALHSLLPLYRLSKHCVSRPERRGGSPPPRQSSARLEGPGTRGSFSLLFMIIFSFSFVGHRGPMETDFFIFSLSNRRHCWSSRL